MSLSNEIKIVRQKAFLTQAQFAEQLHVSFTTINRWETGKARPNLSAMKELKAFCVDQRIEYALVESAWLCNKVEKD